MNKITLDDQQTLALNELLLQLAEVKRTLNRVSRENSGLRSEVSTNGHQPMMRHHLNPSLHNLAAAASLTLICSTLLSRSPGCGPRTQG